MSNLFKLDMGDGSFVIYKSIQSCMFSVDEQDEEDVKQTLSIHYTDARGIEMKMKVTSTVENLQITAKSISAQADKWLEAVNHSK